GVSPEAYQRVFRKLHSLNSRYGRDHLETQYFVGIRTSDIVQQVSRDEVETKWQLNIGLQEAIKMSASEYRGG
ncbi:hypothetical protein C367_05981, partial [Cryptococcus neoformans Ze90-1]